MSLLPLVFPLINLDDFLPNGGKVILRSSRLTALGTDRKEGGGEEGVEVRGSRTVRFRIHSTSPINCQDPARNN